MHLAAWKRVKNAEVVALCDQDSARVESVSKTSGVKNTTTNFDALVARQDVDLISIVTPTACHHSMTLAALNEGKAVLCEKPLGLNLREAQSLTDVAEGKRAKHAVAFEMRYIPSFAYAKELIDEGYLGKLLQANVTMAMAKPWGTHGNWAADEALGGGLLMELGAHFIDALMWWFGGIESALALRETLFPEIKVMPPKDATAQTATRIHVTADDAFTALFKFAQGGTGVMNFVSGTRHDPGWTVSLFGTRGTLIVTTGMLTGTRDGEGEIGRLEIPRRLELPDRPRDPLLWGLTNIGENLVAQIRGDKIQTPAPTFREALAVHRAMDALRKSSDDMMWVGV